MMLASYSGEAQAARMPHERQSPLDAEMGDEQAAHLANAASRAAARAHDAHRRLPFFRYRGAPARTVALPSFTSACAVP